MEWLTDPTIWFGLFTLVVLEIVLGIDNLIFIAILADKLPPAQRDRARQVGLGLALFMRLGLLASLSWLVGLTAPLFTLLSVEISWRDIILIVGGAFLLVKATIEIHDRLEATPHEHGRSETHAAFWPIVAQIIVLDAVFSLDSVITAVGMVDELYVMMIAVVIAVIVMLVASKPLSAFINAHPSLIILCLGFLLMVGFVLVVDGFGYHIPKGYLYAAIGFSVLIEMFNQLGLRSQRKRAASIPRRQRTADVVLRLLAGVPVETPVVAGADASTLVPAEGQDMFAPAEKDMVRGVLTLADRPVKAIMTPRPEIDWIDSAASKETILATVRRSPHRQFVVSRGSLDEIVGIARKDSILALCLDQTPFDLAKGIQEPVVVPENTSILETLELFKRTPVEMGLVVDEYGTLLGVVTRTDLLEAVAGDMPDAGEEPLPVKSLSDGSMILDGSISIYDLQQRLGLRHFPDGDFHTLAGFLMSLFERIPAVGDRIDWGGWGFDVVARDGWRIDKVRAQRIGSENKTVEPHAGRRPA